jgi:hypothetical protein
MEDLLLSINFLHLFIRTIFYYKLCLRKVNNQSTPLQVCFAYHHLILQDVDCIYI